MVRTSRKTPDRWLIYRAIGKVIDGTRLIPFKTPLKAELCRNMKKEDHFDLQTLMHHVASLGKQLGLIIDLTNTDRYYDFGDVQGLNIDYVKINCPGHTIDQREDIVDQFNKIIDDFLEHNLDQDTIIGVHCTHGINRTGYLIIRYLIDRCNWSAETAMEAFERGRGHPIERYVTALYSRAKLLHNADTKKHHRFDAENATSSSNDQSSSSANDTNKKKKKKKKKKGKKKSKRQSATASMIDTKDNEAVVAPTNAANDENMWQMMMMEAAQSMLQSNTDAAASFLAQYNSQAMWHQQAPSTSSVQQIDADRFTSQYAQQQDEQNEVDADDGSADNNNSVAEEGDDDDDDDDDDEAKSSGAAGESDANASGSAAKKRRDRRNRLKHMYKKMKRGKFWEIREIQKERFGF